MRWEPFDVRFWAKVDRLGSSECWLWTGSTDQDGYGKFGRKSLRAHRAAYELANGPIPLQLCVCHSCDNPKCCNPAHLWLGTNVENTADKVAKGRHTHGETVTTSKLTAEQVRAIRLSPLSQEQTAALFGIGQTQISRIIRGEAWAAIP